MVAIALISKIMLVVFVARPWVLLCLLLFIEFLVAKELIAVNIFGSIIQGTSATISAGGPEGSFMGPLLTALVIYLVWISAIRTLGFEDI